MPATPSEPKPILIETEHPVAIAGGGTQPVITVTHNPLPVDFGNSIGIGYVAPGSTHETVFPVHGVVLPASLAGTCAVAGVTVTCTFQRDYTEPYNPEPGEGPKLDGKQKAGGKGGVVMVHKQEDMGSSLAVHSLQPTQYRVTVHVAQSAARGIFKAEIVLQEGGSSANTQTVTLVGNVGMLTGQWKDGPLKIAQGLRADGTLTLTNDSIADLTATVSPGDARFSFDTQGVPLKPHATAYVPIHLTASPSVALGPGSLAVTLNALSGLMNANLGLACVVDPPVCSLAIDSPDGVSYAAGSTPLLSGWVSTSGPDDPSPQWAFTNLPKGVAVASASFPTKVTHGGMGFSLKMAVDPGVSYQGVTQATLHCTLYGGTVKLQNEVKIELKAAQWSWECGPGEVPLDFQHLYVDSLGGFSLSAKFGNEPGTVDELVKSHSWIVVAGLKAARKAAVLFNDVHDPYSKESELDTRWKKHLSRRGLAGHLQGRRAMGAAVGSGFTRRTGHPG